MNKSTTLKFNLKVNYLQWNNLLLINLEKYEDVYNLSLGMAKTHFSSDAGGCRFAAEKNDYFKKTAISIDKTEILC